MEFEKYTSQMHEDGITTSEVEITFNQMIINPLGGSSNIA